MSPDTANSICHWDYPSTSWTLIGRAAGGEADALAALLTIYRPALQAHLQRKYRFTMDLAEERIQGFIADKVINRQLMARANRKLGKFRTYLATALDRYCVSQIRRENAAKRRPLTAEGRGMASLERVAAGQADYVDPFDFAWARQVLEQTLNRMEANCLDDRDHRLWAVFKSRLLDPILEGCPTPPYEQLVNAYGFESPTQAANTLITAKRQFGRTLRQVIAEYAGTPEQIESEIQDLMRILSESRA